MPTIRGNFFPYYAYTCPEQNKSSNEEMLL